jgi:hypothetical protein
VNLPPNKKRAGFVGLSFDNHSRDQLLDVLIHHHNRFGRWASRWRWPAFEEVISQVGNVENVDSLVRTPVDIPFLQAPGCRAIVEQIVRKICVIDDIDRLQGIMVNVSPDILAAEHMHESDLGRV